MGFKVNGHDRDNSQIESVTTGDGLLTSLARQDEIFSNGFRFEAGIARAVMIEGLLLHYLLTKKQVHGLTIDPASGKMILNERITFGQVKDALKQANGFHDPVLETDVEQFVNQRNRVAHHLTAGNSVFDLDGCFNLGRTIALKLWEHILDETRPHRLANP